MARLERENEQANRIRPSARIVLTHYTRKARQRQAEAEQDGAFISDCVKETAGSQAAFDARENICYTFVVSFHL
jgi:hypothetical protein